MPESVSDDDEDEDDVDDDDDDDDDDDGPRTAHQLAPESVSEEELVKLTNKEGGRTRVGAEVGACVRRLES